MPRETRKEIRDRIEGKVPDPSIEETADQLGRQPTQFVRHVRCPLCGMQARADFTETVTGAVVGIAAGPFSPAARTQEFGGSLPSYTGDLRGRAGLMIWGEEEPITEDERELMIQKLREALELLGG